MFISYEIIALYVLVSIAICLIVYILADFNNKVRTIEEDLNLMDYPKLKEENEVLKETINIMMEVKEKKDEI